MFINTLLQYDFLVEFREPLDIFADGENQPRRSFRICIYKRFVPNFRGLAAKECQKQSMTWWRYKKQAMISTNQARREGPTLGIA